jgi:mannitol/fructose-specific phosphotransferase system IIA component (Ntr-type)
MELLDLLRNEHVVIPLEAAGARAAIDQLVVRLEDAGAIGPADALRERLRSEPLREVVSISEDVLLPHYRSGVANSLTIALGISPHGVPAHHANLDARPRVVALVLAPLDAATLYLQATSTLARLLHQPEVVEELVRQPDADHVLALPALQGLPIQHALAVQPMKASWSSRCAGS